MVHWHCRFHGHQTTVISMSYSPRLRLLYRSTIANVLWRFIVTNFKYMHPWNVYIKIINILTITQENLKTYIFPQITPYIYILHIKYSHEKIRTFFLWTLNNNLSISIFPFRQNWGHKNRISVISLKYSSILKFPKWMRKKQKNA